MEYEYKQKELRNKEEEKSQDPATIDREVRKRRMEQMRKTEEESKLNSSDTTTTTDTKLVAPNEVESPEAKLSDTETSTETTTDTEETKVEQTEEAGPQADVEAPIVEEKKESEQELPAEAKEKEKESEKETSEEAKEQASEELESENSESAQEEKTKEAPAGGGGARITDMKDPSLDGGPERLQAENDEVKEKTSIKLNAGADEKVNAGIKKIQELSTNEKEKETPEQKLKHTENAVEEKTTDKEAEKQSKKVEQVAELPKIEAKPEDAKTKLLSSIQDNMPKTIEDVEEFKKKRVASKIGAQVKNTVESKTNEISGNFKQLEKTEKPADPKKAVPLAEIEQADPTPALSLGTELVPKLEDEALDLSSYVEESDNLLKREGIKQEHLDMVDSGDLAEANLLMEDIKTQAEEQPNAIRQEELGEHQQIEKELGYHESLSKEKMEKERNAQLTDGKKTMGGGVSDMEAKRKEVTDHIQETYETTNKTVQEKLDALKTGAFEVFELEEKAASAAFEENVERRKEEFIDERYSGPSGWLLWIEEWNRDMNEVKEIKEIFEQERTAYIARLDAAIGKIMAASQTTIDECKNLISEARKGIAKYVSELEPGLKAIGKAAQDDIAKKFDELDAKVNKAAEELKKELEEKKTKAIAKLDARIEEMKEELKGFLSRAGNFLLDAAMKFFEWALEAAGKSADEIMPIINKGKATISAIVDDPMQFFNNLGSAVGQGINQFSANIKEHMGGGFMTWMTGKMDGLPIQMPEKFDLQGIMSLIMQVLGVGWNMVRGKLAMKIGEENVARMETGVEEGTELVAKVKEKGPIAVWDTVVESAESIKTEVIEGGKQWAAIEIVKQAVLRLVMMLNPAGAVVQAIMAIYNTVMFFMNNWQQVTAFVNSIFDSIGSIAKGAIGAAAGFVEKSMAMAIPLMLDFLAQMLNLGGLADRIQKIIDRVRKPIDQVLERIINLLMSKFKGKKGKKGKKDKDDKDEDKDQKVQKTKKKKSKDEDDLEEETKNKKKGKSKDDKDDHKDDKKAKEQEEKNKKLDQIIKQLEGKISQYARGGVSEDELKAQLRIWKQQYGLKVLLLRDGGEIIAKINPSELVEKLIHIKSSKIAHVLLPIFKEIEELYFAKIKTENPEEYKQATEGFEKMVDSGGGKVKAFDGTKRDMQQVVLREGAENSRLSGKEVKHGEIESGVTVSNSKGNMLSTTVVQHSGSYDAKVSNIVSDIMSKSDKFKLGLDRGKINGYVKNILTTSNEMRRINIIDELETYIKDRDSKNRKSVTAMIAGITRNLIRDAFLLQALEPARQEGMSTTTALGHELANQDKNIDVSKQLLHSTAPLGTMTPQGASMKERENESKQDKKKRQKAEKKRMRRTGNIVKHLLLYTDQSGDFYSSGSFDLGPLAGQIKLFLKARLIDGAAEAEVEDLKSEFIRLLTHHHGR